ncbi:MAG TPA: helix-turn-helix domain-containing protein [Xanthobacteraceae bacterium]|nr:helix-turn-helix domain-containing protein [Xanthobacteraceae bacterium]
MVTQTFVALECDTPNKAQFSGSIRHCQIGRVGITDVAASAQRARRTPASIARGPSDDLIAVLQITGPCHVGQAARTIRIDPGEGAMVQTAQTYAFEFPGPFRQLVLKVPRSLVGEGSATPGRHLAFTRSTSHLLRELALCALDEAENFALDEQIGIERAFSALLRSAQADLVSVQDGEDPTSRVYAAARRFIEKNLGDPRLSPAAIAAHIGVSTRTLARIFALRGVMVDRTIWTERLSAAKRDLMDVRLQHMSITSIAFSWAFNDAAHFSRSFSKAYGIPPREFRLSGATLNPKDK